MRLVPLVRARLPQSGFTRSLLGTVSGIRAVVQQSAARAEQTASLLKTGYLSTASKIKQAWGGSGGAEEQPAKSASLPAATVPLPPPPQVVVDENITVHELGVTQGK